MELALRRDERIMRFLTVKLDKYGVKYNDDKRNGLIGKKRSSEQKEEPKKELAAKKTVAPKPKPAPAPTPEVVASSEEE